MSYKSEGVHAIRQYEFGPPETLRHPLAEAAAAHAAVESRAAIGVGGAS